MKEEQTLCTFGAPSRMRPAITPPHQAPPTAKVLGQHPRVGTAGMPPSPPLIPQQTPNPCTRQLLAAIPPPGATQAPSAPRRAASFAKQPRRFVRASPTSNSGGGTSPPTQRPPPTQPPHPICIGFI